MKADIINSQVDRFIFPVAHDVIVLASDRLRFLNLVCDTGHLSFEMSCSFTVQVPAQLDLLRKVTCFKAFNSGALDGEELFVVELLEFGTNPAGAFEVEVTNPSCKSASSKSAGYDCVNNATVRQGRV